jgi:TRAP-type C4-dicarboxylate transport system permease large subunit
MILSIIIDVVVLSLIAYIALNYYKFWRRYLQMYEPFTRWFSRIATAWPWVWWPLQAVILIGAIVVIFCTPFAYPVLGVVGVGFMGWFIPHIGAYVTDHAADNPVNTMWFLRRIK